MSAKKVMKKMTENENNIVTLPSMENIEAEAASWLTVLGREHVSEEDKGKLNQWLGQSARHRAAFKQLSALMGDLPILKELCDIEVSTPQENKRSKFNPVVNMGRRHIFGIAASFVAIASLGGVGRSLYVNGEQADPVRVHYATTVGEQRTVKLSDGSEIQINTDSQVDVMFTKETRVLHLVRGEAYFDVAKDKGRPFLVYAGDGLVRAVGTAFSVRLRMNDAVEVIVEEGRVELMSLKTPVLKPVAAPQQTVSISVAELTPGQSAVFTKKVESLAQIPQSELNRRLLWRQGLLAYSGEPLSYVINDISRYTDVHIEITDTSIQDIPIGGYYRVGEIDALFEALELTFGLSVEHVDANHVNISAAQNNQQ